MIHRLIMLLVVALALPFMGVGGSLAHAQGQDPTLAAMILLYTQKAKSELKQQEAMMLLESTGHIWITEEVNATTDLQKQFNKYLDSFHGIIMYAAQIYGFYHEIDHLVTNLGAYQVIRYGKYEVTYSHLSNVFANYAAEVKAGQVVAVSADMLHIEVKYNGEELNPLEFLTMIYGNLKALEQNGTPGAVPQFVTIDMDVHTMYDKDQKEIEDLMMRWFPDYMQDLSAGIYALPEHTELALRNMFTMSAMKNYFFETIPSMANPLGMGTRSIPLAEKVQNLLIADFLNYMALRHQIFLSSMSQAVKKKPMTKQ